MSFIAGTFHVCESRSGWPHDSQSTYWRQDCCSLGVMDSTLASNAATACCSRDFERAPDSSKALASNDGVAATASDASRAGAMATTASRATHLAMFCLLIARSPPESVDAWAARAGRPV